MYAFDFTGATLKTSDRAETVLADRSISTMHRGKGCFEFTPTRGQSLPLLEIYADGQTHKRSVSLSFVTRETSDITFMIMNKNRVLGNSDALELHFGANENVSPNMIYFIQIKNKERILHSEQLIFTPRSMRMLSIDASKFPQTNGGILTFSLYKATNDFMNLQAPPTTSLQITRWLVPQGEALFFKKPVSNLEVAITLDKSVYGVGNDVSYLV